MSKKITVIDYGAGNLLSIVRAFEHCGAEAVVVDKPEDVANAEYLVLPGVGAYSKGMSGLKDAGFVDEVLRFTETDRPFLGICLGMQMLLQESREFGKWEGLGVVPGTVDQIPATGSTGEAHKIPFIGWSKLKLPEGMDSWDGTILNKVDADQAFYFVHSFMAIPEHHSDRLAEYDYNGLRICAAVRKNNVTGTQFHPEKSGEAGLNIIRSFLEI